RTGGDRRGRDDAHSRAQSSTSRGFASVPPMNATAAAPVSIVVMEGDGIGPEITAATLEVLGAAERVFKLPLAFTPVAIGLAALRAQGTTLPESAVAAAQAADG